MNASPPMTAYAALRPCQSTVLPIRTFSYHVRSWPALANAADQPPLVLLHGWMDVAASWQFVVDALTPGFAEQRTIIAPDWRGFGLSRPVSACDDYTIPDYLADLDLLLDRLAGDSPVDLVGHSMGGNLAMMYAGVRPGRIRRLVNLEGFGQPATAPEQAPARYAQWMDQVKALHAGQLALRSYADVQGVAQRLMKTNPRLPADKALWLARHWAAPNAQGEWEILGDAAHKIINAQLYRVDEALALYQAITAPVLAVHASDDSLGGWWKGRYTLQEYHQRLTHVRNVRTAVVQDAGHMLHHDQPQAVAGLIEEFVTAAVPVAGDRAALS